MQKKNMMKRTHVSNVEIRIEEILLNIKISNYQNNQ